MLVLVADEGAEVGFSLVVLFGIVTGADVVMVKLILAVFVVPIILDVGSTVVVVVVDIVVYLHTNL